MKILKYQSFFENIQEETQGQCEPEKSQKEADFRKIMVPG